MCASSTATGRISVASGLNGPQRKRLFQLILLPMPPLVKKLFQLIRFDFQRIEIPLATGCKKSSSIFFLLQKIPKI